MGKHSQKPGGESSRIQDPRFASFETDPRFRLPSKKNTKTKLDERFSRMLVDDDFTTAAKVDRYGRKLSGEKKKKALERLYEKEDDEEENKDNDEEEKEEEEEEEEEEDNEDALDDDEDIQRELRSVTARYDPARDGGFSSSDEDDSDDDINEDDETAIKGSMQRLADEQAEVEEGEVTRRVAIVNLDWDYVKAADLMALFTSFLPAKSSGKVLRVSVYPSEFGKERMQREELEGPPKEIFKAAPKIDDINDKNNNNDDDDDEELDSDAEDEKIKKELLKEATDQDFDSDALRGYQLDRLRYFYAVMECSDAATAKALYDQTDGTEYLSSSNFLDLRFIPDDVTFDDEPRDSVTKVPKGYKPVEFVTNALQSSKVKLTWDMHPEEAKRKESMRKAFSGSRDDIEENDLRAYLASDGSDSEYGSDVEEVVDATESLPTGTAGGDVVEPKLSKKELARRKMREALGLSAEPTARNTESGPVGDMQITFTSALSEKEPKKTPGEDETTLEKYVRKEKERKEKKRAKAKAKHTDGDTDANAVEQDDSDVEMVFGDGAGDASQDLGFDDPFFTTDAPSGPAPSSKTSQRKEDRLKKRAERDAQAAALAAEKAKLAAVMAADASETAARAAHLDHFDMADIRKAERAAAKGKKGRKAKRAAAAAAQDGSAAALQTDYTVPVDDARFGAVFTEHEFAIDPSNPKFSGTQAMKTLLEEGRKKRKTTEEQDGERRKKKKKDSAAQQAEAGDLKGLVESVKRKVKKN
ncbi:hypothetical protein TD95_004993 [Thielaviopsis punctulata]|uniref:Uncharacterized protein n=1 Tax=Thielaviopsis punctulata TaxID=72032 RepID=A0A0F4ZDE2_9PEZI|nr:hypothetical protein TD95_004993 [Thielaviopsis punctulata]